MTPEYWQQVKKIFNSALRYEPSARAEYLSRACSGDTALRKEVESLIASHEKDASFIESPAYQAVANSLTEEPLAKGRLIGHYEILGVLGKGGMGEVYLANDTKLGRKVALKFLPFVFTNNKDRLRRFEREARAASALNQPNILTVHEIGEADGLRFIATEFVEGETLRQRVVREPEKVAAAIDIAEQIAAALAAAHTEGIVHRDIKPDNVMLRRDGYVKVLDFGLAKLTLTTQESKPEDATREMIRTSAGMVMGTAQYMSPEQARGLEVDARSDIWSLGVVLYEMVTGRAPFSGPTTSDVIVAVLDREPDWTQWPRDQMAAELEWIVRKSLRKEKEERYQTARELHGDLKRLRQRGGFSNESSRSSPSDVGLKDRTAAVDTTDPPGPRATEVISAVSRTRIKIALVVLLSLGLLAAAFAGYRYFGNRTHGQINSIAVMPFVNASGKADVEYLSDGLTDSLIFRFSQLPNVKVSPTSSVMRFKNTSKDVAEVAKELNVDAVLTGRLMQAGDELSISVQLVDARTQKLVWATQYDRKMTDLLATQREIATTLTQKMQLQLASDELGITKKYTSSNEAYQLYMKGRFHYARRNKDDLFKAIDAYKQAIALDPKFALAYAATAEVYNSLGKNPELAPKDCIPLAKAAATRALEIDPMLPQAHSALGDSLAIYEWNWKESEKHFRKALELDPNISYTHIAYSISYLAATGKADQVVSHAERAVELEPVSVINNVVLASALIYARRYDRALTEATSAFDLDPNFPLARYFLGIALVANGKYDEAVAFGRQVSPDSPYGWMSAVVVAQAFAKQGRRTEAEQQIALLHELSRTRYVRTFFLASIYATFGRQR